MRSPLAWLLDKAIGAYQVVFASRPSPCRHIPSCSVYGREAVQTHGGIRGSWLILRRLGRCHPWGTEGFDPVPDRRARRRRASIRSESLVT